MTYATVCSGVEAHSMAVAPFGWKPLFFSEIEDFPSVVLAHRFPSVPNLGDMTKITYDPFKGVITNGEVEIKYEVGSLGCLSGGTPCQDVSVAGKRRGMSKDSGTRSSLAFHFARLVRELRPRWVVWENVPGVLSSNGGRDFALFAGEIAKCGYGIAYRTFDAQYVRTAHIQGGRVDGYPRAVAQRRRRVWLVGHLGADARVPVEILFEPRSLRGNQPPSRYTREELAALACGGVGADDSVVEGEERGGAFRRGVAVENNTLRIAETTRTLSGDHDSRVTDTGTTVVQSKTSNGDDVYPTLTSRDLVAQVCKEQENRGGGMS